MSELRDRILNRALLLQIGVKALMIIKTRTLAGEFLPGSTGTNQYSTTPMPLPWAALQKTVRNSATVRNLIDSGDATVFRSKAGKKWIVLQEGYKQFRELAGKSTDHVTLTWSGGTLRDLKVKTVNVTEGSVVLGFTDSRAEQLADYHNNQGAGKSKITHKFLGFTEAELSEIVSFVQRLVVR